MRIIRFLGVFLVLLPCVSFGAGRGDFQTASRLLTAARRGDTQTVQVLINNGADVNYVDATGMSLVCTAVMNNDKRAIQILQMYGADASNCDRQIKQYKQKSRVAARGEETGFFSGLSSTHILALSAVGAAAVIGGVVLLAKVFDKDSGHSSSASNGNRPNNNNPDNPNGGTQNTTVPLLTRGIPNGPGCNGDNCSSDFNTWEQMQDFTYMSNGNAFNYLMVSRAYNAFVRGYLGMSTIRLASDLSPFNLSDLPYPATSLPGGGNPVNVAMVTASGVNTTGSAVEGLIPWIDSTQITSVQTICNNNGANSTECQTALTNATKIAHKYYNYSGAVAGQNENVAFNLSGDGSVFGMATDADTKLAKIIAGWEEGGRSADFYGFIPNGQLTVYKTGGGYSWQNPTSSYVTGAYTTNDDVLSGLELADGTVLTVTSISNGTFVATDSSNRTYTGFIVGNDIYIDSNADGNINQIYTLSSGNALTLTKELEVADYKNYAAIYDALTLKNSGNYVTNVVANLSLPTLSSDLSYVTVSDANVLTSVALTPTAKKSVYTGLINSYYNLNSADDSDGYSLPSGNIASGKQSDNAENVFTYLSNNQKHILVNPAGRMLYGLGDGHSVSPMVATFENFAPVIYPDLKNLFMTVVALKPANGTSGDTITGYTHAAAGKLSLSTWTGTDSNVYTSRICGLTGTGNGGAMNPWCFAAPGNTDMEATAAMAGSVALVNSAFAYMTPNQVFLLLALTADGPYLKTDTDIITYLRGMYVLPENLDSTDAQYLESFKTAFGYGMINLERATQPGTNIYFYDSTNNIVSSGGKNAYWGKVTSSGASSRASSVLALNGRSSIITSFYDVVESADGTISLPRVWNNTLTMDNNSKHGLYMGDVLGEFSVASTNKRHNQIGKVAFDMSLSPRAYNDNLNGLDNLNVSFQNEKYDINANYQHHLTDGMGRFDGRANGLLSLVSNSVITGAKYKYGNFAFSGRVFSGNITDENLLENDPVVSSQFEPMRLGIANGAEMATEYHNDNFAFNIAFGNLHEANTVLGMYSDGLLTMRGGDTQYVDISSEYKPFEKLKLFARATFANTRIKDFGGIISDVSNIKSNAFAFGTDFDGFNFTVALPLATVDGKMGYDYAEFDVVENNGKYEIAMNNPHVEYVDLSAQKREMRFSTSYKKSIDELTDAGVGMIYRVHPNNTNRFGNESIFMFKINHKIGI